MASSIHIKKATAGSVAHNSRETHSYSVVFPDEKNECSHTSKEAFKEYRQELAIRAKAYQDRTHQKLQKNAITHLSAVVNLEQHHTLKDLETIKKEIEKKFDTKVFQMSIHRDEGKLVSKEDEKLTYTSGEDFFMDPKTQELFWDKKFTKKVDMSQYDILKNYHAHIEFLGLDSRGEAIKRNYMSKYNLSNFQTFVAKELKMERGKNYYETKEKAPKRLDVLEFKRANTKKRENTQELVKALEDKYKKEREELKASGAAKQADYQALKADFEKQKKELESVKADVLFWKEQTETWKKFYEKEKAKAPVVVEKEKVVEKIVTVQDTKRIQELQEALESTNATLGSVQSAFSAQNANMTTLALAIESSTEYKRDIYKEQHFDFIKRVVSSLVEKVQSLSKQLSSFLTKQAPQKTEQEPVMEKEKVVDKDLTRMERREALKQELAEHLTQKPEFLTFVEIDAEVQRQSDYTKEESKARWWGDGGLLREKRLNALRQDLETKANTWENKQKDLERKIDECTVYVKSVKTIAEETRALQQSYGMQEDQGMSR